MSEPHQVRPNKDVVFLVMDGRARYDISKASIIEVIDEVNYERVWKTYQKEYKENYDYCLVVLHNYESNKLKYIASVDSFEELLAIIGEL